MQFTSIFIDNYRGFAGFHDVQLHPRLTVLAGVNGAGKSAMLDAAATALGNLVLQLAKGKNQTWFGGGDQSNIRAGQTSARWGVLWRTGAGPEETGIEFRSSFDDHAQDSEGEVQPRWPDLDALRAASADPAEPLPLFAYLRSGSTRAPTKHEDIELTGRFSAYQGAFDSESVQFDALSAWFEQEENVENEEKIRKGSFAYERPSLRAIRTAVERCLSHLHGARLKGLRVIRSRGTDPRKPVTAGRLAMEKDGHVLFVEQLSDGERRLVLLVADTARRMVVLNPKMEQPLDTEGLLLIDEIELHLHPQWQRTVIGALQAAFPKMQMVVATHAPAVLATVPNESVVILHEGKVLAGSVQVFGRDPNTILESVMDTPLRPDAVQKKLDALFAAIDRGTHPKKLMKELEAMIGSDDPDLVRARALLHLLAG